MNLGLLTITHDEPDFLQRMLASVEGVVDGPTVATHIGEQDESFEILSDFGADVTREDWREFDGSFNALFQRAHGRAGRWLLMGASHLFRGELPDLNPSVPCYMVEYERGPYTYRVENLLRGDIEWSISAPVHGIIEPCFLEARKPIDGISIYEDESNGRRPEKIARYLPVCEKMVADDPTPRAVFYLARTYFDLGRYEEAVEHYDWRIRMGAAFEEEWWYAHYMRGVALIRQAKFSEGRAALLAAYHLRPTRAEPLHAICKSMNPPDDLLFIEREVYA